MYFKLKTTINFKNKNFKKIQSILVDNFKNLQLAPNILEELVQSHYKENKKIVSPRRDFAETSC